MRFSLARALGSASIGVSWTIIVILTCGWAVMAQADMINGSAEFNTNTSRSTTKDATGAVTSDSRGTDFMHKYNLSLDMTPFPLLKLSAGSSFVQDISILHDIGTTSRSKTMTLSPYFDAMLTNSLYQAAIGYSRNENWLSGNQVEPTPATINEEYHATFGWRPTELPDLTVRLSHTNTFDADRLNQDATTNMAIIGSQYSYKALKLGYQFTGSETLDNLHATDNISFLNNGSASYSDQFFNQRVSVYSHYNVNYLESTTKAGNGGMVDTPTPSPNTGLSYFNSEPADGKTDHIPNGDLTNFNFNTSAGINLIVDSLADPLAQFKKWSIGVDFANVTEVNKLLVYVDRQLPAAIAGAFSWQVWIRNTPTDDWTQIDQNGNQVVPPNPANTVAAVFEWSPSQKAYEFTLTLNHSVKARFIKVVVNALPLNTLTNLSDPKQIFVTEFQPFLRLPAAQVQGTSSRLSQNFNMDVRTRLLDSPSLYHSLNLSLSDTTGGQISYVLDNSLVLDHRFNSIFAVGATAGREDISSGGQSSTAYLYSASLKAAPLTGLSNALVYSGRIDQTSRGSSTSNSLFLTNTAEPYRGIAFNLSSGYSLATNLTGQQSESLSLSGGASVSPRQDLSFNVSYNRSMTTLSGGTTAAEPVAASTTTSQSGQFGASYRPFSNLYLFASLGVQQADGKKTQYVQNYGGTWSPFPDGTLQFTIAYNESINSLNNEKDSSLTPTISWKIAPKAMLSMSYSLLRSDSLISSTESTYFSTLLRLAF